MSPRCSPASEASRLQSPRRPTPSQARSIRAPWGRCPDARAGRIYGCRTTLGITMNHLLARAFAVVVALALCFSADAQVLSAKVTGGELQGVAANGVVSFK